MLIKVCGLRELPNIREVLSVGEVNLIGLIFYPKSLRYVDPLAESVLALPLKNAPTVGVFVNAAIQEVLEKCTSLSLKFVQLHGNETVEYLVSLRKVLPAGVGIIKAFSISQPIDIDRTKEYEGLCSYYLFDTASPGYGGSGVSFDWSMLNTYSGETKFLISGGIHPKSGEALKKFHHPLCAGIDLNSRFETSPAIKDVTLLSDFIHSLNFK